MSSSSMGYIYHYHPAFWRKYHYLTAVGLDCGSQLMSTIMALGISLPHVTFPKWWGNNPTFPDRYELTDIFNCSCFCFCFGQTSLTDGCRCFPPNSKLPMPMQKSASS